MLEQKYQRDNGLEQELKLDKLYLGHKSDFPDKEPDTTYPAKLLPTTKSLADSVTPLMPDLTLNYNQNIDFDLDKAKNMAQRSITEKPNERCPSPVVPAYANFELAKRMHHDNLDHQPLPDCVADLAYRKLQITGEHPGLALDIDPIATGVGVKTHNAGPTHCTKMKVFRPKTCGVVPKVYNNNYRPISGLDNTKKMGAMDLAICWDYKPSNPLDEPRRAAHIDGSNDSAGPAVFNYVKSPRPDEGSANMGRSAGIFNSTLGEPGFFDKDIMRRKTDFMGRNIDSDDLCNHTFGDAYASDPTPAPTRARSVTRDFNASHRMPQRFGKQYQSSPNIMDDQTYKQLKEKYLGPSADCDFDPSTGPVVCKPPRAGRLFRRACHKVAPEPVCCPMQRRVAPACKAAFRVGVPKYNAAGHFVSSDSGCSMMDNCHNSRVVVVPKPRNPYSKKNYDIDTLVPPFRSFAGGSGQGGYPEHWRLASVYQHAYKPLEQRRRPLLQTVYK